MENTNSIENNLNYDPSGHHDQQQTTNSIAAVQHQHGQNMNSQQPQAFVFGQQQAMNMASPYFVANTAGGQELYGQNGGIPVVNANGQTAVIHPQYAAAYGIQPYVYANQNGGTYVQQQQPQQMGQQSQEVRSPTTSTSSQHMNGQQIPPGYQVVQGPLNFPAGSTFYDQHGNPVIINGRMAAPMTNHLGQPVRMMSPVVLNANGAPTVSPGIHSGTSPSMQIYGQQQQQAGQQQQQQQQRAG